MSTYEPCVLGSDGNCTRWSHDHAADRPPVTDDARAVREAAISLYRAMRRANPDAWAEVDEVEDWAYWDDIVRTAQVTLAAGRAETTTATIEDAEEVLHGAGWFARADLDPRDLRGILHDLADAGLLATARTRPTREQIDRAVGEVLFNAMNHPDPAAVLGRSIVPLRTKVTDAVLELLRDGAR